MIVQLDLIRRKVYLRDTMSNIKFLYGQKAAMSMVHSLINLLKASGDQDKGILTIKINGKIINNLRTQ